MKPAFFNNPLVNISKPASIAPLPLALSSINPVFLFSVSLNNSSSNLLPATLKPKATIPQGPSLAATSDGIDSIAPSTVLSAADLILPPAKSLTILPLDLSMCCARDVDISSKVDEGLIILFLSCIAFFSAPVNSSPKASLAKTSTLVLIALA